MKATRHNGRTGKHGTYDAKHNDRRFDVENSEHIDAERTKFNVYLNFRSRMRKRESTTIGRWSLMMSAES